jgi:diacylglycerol kinase family enzyme
MMLESQNLIKLMVMILGLLCAAAGPVQAWMLNTNVARTSTSTSTSTLNPTTTLYTAQSPLASSKYRRSSLQAIGFSSDAAGSILNTTLSESPLSSPPSSSSDAQTTSNSTTPALVEALEDSTSGATTSTVEIVLNTNAKGVTPSVAHLIESIVNSTNDNNANNNVRVHITSTKEQAQQVARQIMKADRPTPASMVIPIGGDGTLTTMLQLLWDAAKEQQKDDDPSSTSSASSPIQFPPIGYIAMGTGNALGSVVGCRPARLQGRRQRWTKALLSSVKRPSSVFFGQSRKLQTLSDTLSQLLQVVASSDTTALEDGSSSSSSSSVDIVEIPLLQVTTTTTTSKDEDPNTNTESSSLCFFAGVGFDSLMLQDFKDLQEWTNTKPKGNRRFFKEYLSSVTGYCVALVTKTLPQCVLQSKHLVQVQVSTDQPESTVWIDHRRGDVVRSVSTTTTSSTGSGASQTQEKNNKDNKTLLYQGEAGIVAVGSAPFYGGGLRLFPFARMSSGGMQLRIGRIHPLRGTMNIPRIFRGSYRDTRDNAFGCLDFMGSHFTVEILDRAYPVQHSGDFIGTSSRIDFSMVPSDLEPVRFVTLLPPRLVIEEPPQEQAGDQ